MDKERKKIPVLIVGAGPTGLVLALWLKKKGIDFRLIDKSDAPGKTSRALAVQARTLEFYRQLGIAEELIRAGVTADEIILRRRGKVVDVGRLGALGKFMSYFPHLLFCSQDIHEDLLCKKLAELGVQVERQTELLQFSQNEKHVQVELKTVHGNETVEAEYVCGCDGAHSPVRHNLELQFPGGTYSQVFFVADVKAEGEMSQSGVQISLSSKDFCIVMPIKEKGSVRLTGLVPPESESKENIVYEDVKDSVERNTGLQIKNVNWFSVYHVHHRMAERFQSGRVFLAGDAGHIHSPAGGQGMNTGIGDAVNLAWKLAEVIQGRFTADLLKTYEPERMSFAKILLKTTDTAFRFIASRSWFGSIFRAYLLPRIFSILTRFDFFLKFAFRTISQIRIKYPESSLSQGHLDDIHSGDRLPWIKIESSDNYECLKSLNWQFHIYGNVKSDFQNYLQKINIELVQFPWKDEMRDKGFSRDAAYLIRPDGYIALISNWQNVQEVKTYLDRQGFHPLSKP